MRVRLLRRQDGGQYLDEGVRHVLVAPQTAPSTLDGVRPKAGDRLRLETAGPVQVFQLNDLAEWPLGGGRYFQVTAAAPAGAFATRWQYEAERFSDEPDILVRLTDAAGNVLTDDAGDALVAVQ